MLESSIRVANWRKSHPDARKEYDTLYNNSDAHREANKRYRQTKKGKEVVLEARHRYMARQRGLPHDLTAEEWEYIKSRYPICLRCGRPFSKEMPPTPDHVIPVSRGGGYTKLNIRPLCLVCNVKKGNKMDFLSYRVKVMENFKDGNIMGGRFLKAGEILVLSEQDFVKVTNSGGLLEIVETLIPNPKKEVVEPVEAIENKLAQAAAEIAELEALENEIKQANEKIYRAEDEPKPEPKKRGRPRKAQ